MPQTLYKEGKVMRKEFEKEHIQNMGRLTHANGKGIFAVQKGREERMVGAWYLPADAPLISTIENRADYIIINYAGKGVVRLDIGEIE